MQENLNISLAILNQGLTMLDQAKVLCKPNLDHYEFIGEQTPSNIGRFHFYAKPVDGENLAKDYKTSIFDKDKIITPSCYCASNVLSTCAVKINIYDCESKTQRDACLTIVGSSRVVNLNNYIFNNVKKVNKYIVDSSQRSCNEMCAQGVNNYALPLKSYYVSPVVSINTMPYSYDGGECVATEAKSITYLYAYATLIGITIISFLTYLIMRYWRNHEDEVNIQQPIIMEMQPLAPVAIDNIVINLAPL